MKKIDITKLSRYKTFEFFKNYENPFFNICANVDVTELYQHTHKNNISFFAASLFLSQLTIHEIDALKMRIRDDEVILHNIVDVGSTVLNDNETFSFCYFDFSLSFAKFIASFEKEIVRNKLEGVSLKERDIADKVIHYSVIPWVSFTSISHARKGKSQDSTPRIVFGKYFDCSTRKLMPVSIEAHHSLADGIHIGRYFENFQNNLNQSAKLLST